MKIYCNGIARIQDSVTGKIHEIGHEELDWAPNGSDERQMGPENHYEAVLEHSDLGLLKWELWEYPVGVENDRERNVGTHKVIEDFDYGFEHEKPEPDVQGPDF